MTLCRVIRYMRVTLYYAARLFEAAVVIAIAARYSGMMLMRRAMKCAIEARGERMFMRKMQDANVMLQSAAERYVAAAHLATS